MMKKERKWNTFKKNPVAYFCAEFALEDKMPSYAGGLGILAGDYVLEAAKENFPIVGLGLYYQKGQNDRTVACEPDATKFSLKLVFAPDKKNKLLIPIPIGEKDILAQVWQWKKKNNSVYFLDTNIPENNESERLITEQLYVEDRELRLKQELILGIGGVRLLKKLNVNPSVYHLNEGHSALLIIELIGEEIRRGLNFAGAFEKVKKNIVFTNHTLVLEGQEMFAFDSLIRLTKKLCENLNIDIEDVIKKGKLKPTDSLFSLTTFALNGASMTNAVSYIHGVKARELWPEYPIIHITNGIFLPRWDKIKTGDIVRKHQKNEEVLLKLIRGIRGDDWKKEALLIGWSRRFVPYKRPLALLDDIAKLRKILQFFRGKVHIVYSAPLDEKDAEHNEFLKRIYSLMNGELKGFLTFIPHYKINTAELLTAGCDIWLNTPIVGREACGTSGMKAGLNGTLSVSTNDGWVQEVALNDFGWLIDDQNITDNLLNKLQNEIIPEFEKFTKKRKNSAWEKFMTKSREIIKKNFSTERMLREYIEKMYRPTSGPELKPSTTVKKLIAFDVDGTLSKSRSQIDSEMANLLQKLLKKKKVAIITGGAFADIEKQVLTKIDSNNKRNKNLILLPTNGGGLYIFNKKWTEIFSHDLTADEKWKVVSAIQEVVDRNKNINDFGDKIQDREAEITYSALGEHAPIELKHAWDPDFKKRIALQEALKKRLPEFEVKIGGTTSIDITPKGMDKAYAIRKILDHFRLDKKDILFVGDAVYENGNDYPVFLMKVDTIKVSGPDETKEVIKKLLDKN